MGPTWGPSGADRTQVGPMMAPWTLLSGAVCIKQMIKRHTGASYCDLYQPWLQYHSCAGLLFCTNRGHHMESWIWVTIGLVYTFCLVGAKALSELLLTFASWILRNKPDWKLNQNKIQLKMANFHIPDHYLLSDWPFGAIVIYSVNVIPLLDECFAI